MNRILMVLLAFLLSFATSAHAQTTARLPDGHWSITVPQGWSSTDDSVLQKVNQMAAGVNIPGAGRIQYVMMLVSAERPGCYVLVQWGAAPPSGGSFDGYVKGILSGIDSGVNAVRDAMPDQISSASFDAPVIDRQRQRIYLPGSTTGPNGGTIKSITCPQLGTGETISVHGYSPAETFDQNKPALIAIADSFAFDQGYAYTFVTAKGFDFGQMGIAGIIGGVVGLAVWGVRKLKG